MKKEKSNNGKSSFGNKLTSLTEEESKTFLDRYSGIIKRECKKRGYIPGMDQEDLQQECAIRLLSGYHSFKEEKAKEKTWAINIIKKTIMTIQSTAMKTIRACHVPSEENKTRPVYNFSLDSFFHDEEERSFEEEGEVADDGRPIYATREDSPEETFAVLRILEVMEKKMPKEILEYIKAKIIPSQEETELLEASRKIENELKCEGIKNARPLSEYGIYAIFSSSSEKEVSIISNAAEFFIRHLNFPMEEILGRKMTQTISPVKMKQILSLPR